MLLLLTCMLATVAAAPTYDQRQEGDFNVRADVQNVVLLLLRPEKISTDILDLFSKSAKRQNHEEAQDRSDIHLESFVEPNEPYRVEIGSEKLIDADGRKVEVVIAGRRRLDAEQEAEPEKDEYKLIGATEQCGPERVRDPVTLTCRFKASVPVEAPEVIPST